MHATQIIIIMLKKSKAHTTRGKRLNVKVKTPLKKKIKLTPHVSYLSCPDIAILVKPVLPISG